MAPPNPLRGLAHDAENIASFVNQIDGPVLLVGHSYGGAVISVAGPELYREAFAADLSEDDVRVLAAWQRPFAAIFDERAAAAAWKSLPSWYMVATGDNAIA